jgi:HK97 family phage major capsid protein
MSLDNIEIRNEPENLDDATRAVNELRSASETFRTELNTRLTTETRAIGDRLAALETRLSRPGAIQTRNENEPSLQRRAFQTFVRSRPEDYGLIPTEIRTVMTEATSGAGGGYLIPPEFMAEVDRNLVQFSPMRQLARVIQISTNGVIWPKRTTNVAATWEGETDAEPATNPVYAQGGLTAYELKAYVDVSNRMIEDSAIDIDAELALDLGQAFGQAEGAAFIVGTGDSYKMPLGLTGSTITTTTVAATTGPTTDELIDFFHSLPSPYSANATWLMNLATIGYVRKLKNEAGEYMWQGPLGPLSVGNPGYLLGRPVVEAPDMPNLGAANIAIALGDYKSGFRIVDRVGLAVLRDPYSQASASNIRFHARRRVGGGVTKAEAIRLMKCAAS